MGFLTGDAGMRWSPGLALSLLLLLLAGLAAFPWRSEMEPLILPQAADRTDLLGQVIGPDGPLAEANVRLKGTATRTTTDAEGHFRLPRRGSARRVTVWREGYLIGGARLDTSPLVLRLKPLPQDDNEAYEWVDPAPRASGEHNCGNCHGDIYREWSASGHSRSADGRHFRNLYEGTDVHGARAGWGLLTQYPDGAGVCTSCHAPSIRDRDPAQLDLRELRGVAARGVHCDYCHKIAGVGDGDIGRTHGRFNLRLLRPSPGHQLFFGPLDDVDRGEDAYSPLYRESRYCASCHEGIVFGVHVYSTYSEWLESRARREGRHCQDCHMRPTGRMTNLAPGHGGIERDPKTLANHRFFHGSRESMLRDCVRVSAVLRRQEQTVQADVRVAVEGVGHRVPTGFVDRHLLLVVEGLAADGSSVPLEAGPTLPAPAGPDLVGKPGQLFAKLLQDYDQHAPAPFWRAFPEARDTRLTPGQPERSVFVFPAHLGRLRVQVLYRRFWQEVARVKGWPDEDVSVFDRTFASP
jgi:hypothetical protein